MFAASMWFIITYAAQHSGAVTGVSLANPAWIAVSLTLYAISHISTGLSWPLTLRQLGEPIPLLEGIRIGLISQAGKYLPGNIAHYLGRGGLAAAAGIPIKASSVSVAVELTSALSAGILLACVMLYIEPITVDFLPALSAGEILLGSASAAIALGVVIWSVRKGYSAYLFALPTACLATSFAFSGLSFHALVVALGHTEVSMAAAIGAFALAWIAGFILPGAPAGLGVREAVLISFVGPVIGPGPALASVLLHRLITAVIDGLAALLGYFWLASTSLAKK